MEIASYGQKKVELAVKKVISGKPAVNKDALRNPEALDYYAGIKELERETRRMTETNADE